MRLAAGAARDLCDGQHFGARQRHMRFDARGAAVGHQEFPGLAARAGDSVGKGQRDESAARGSARRLGPFSQFAGRRAQKMLPAVGETAAVLAARRMVAGETVQPLADVGPFAAKAALGQEQS